MNTSYFQFEINLIKSYIPIGKNELAKLIFKFLITIQFQLFESLFLDS